MTSDLLDLYDRASAWTTEKVAGAVGHLDGPTVCDDWTVRVLLDHMLETQRFFLGQARGEDVAPPGPTPPAVIGDDPRADFERARQEVLEAFADPGTREKTGPALGIAFADQLLHGWDIARATGQDPTMPAGLAGPAYDVIHGRFTDEQRVGVFKPELPVAADADPQDKLLAYTGRRPA
ncbi:MAG TPA: TIGR03086 family metal-binding protein [Acidimicrobiales bacterium]|nr:TIGR03086 family metal-binding protein [Acidimicrobiales bacterium]